MSFKVESEMLKNFLSEQNYRKKKHEITLRSDWEIAFDRDLKDILYKERVIFETDEPNNCMDAWEESLTEE